MSVSDATSLGETDLLSHGSSLTESQSLAIGLGIGGGLLLVVLVSAAVVLYNRRGTTLFPPKQQYAHIRGPSLQEKNSKEPASSSKSLNTYGNIIRNSISNSFTYKKWKNKLDRKKNTDVENGFNADTSYRTSIKSEKSGKSQSSMGFRSHASGDITDETRLFQPITMDFSSPQITLTLANESNPSVDDYKFPMPPPLPRKSSRRDSTDGGKLFLGQQTPRTQTKSRASSPFVSRQSSLVASSFAYLASHITSPSPAAKAPEPMPKYSPVDQDFEFAPPKVPRKSSKRMSVLAEQPHQQSIPQITRQSLNTPQGATQALQLNGSNSKGQQRAPSQSPISKTKTDSRHRATFSNASTDLPNEDDYALAAQMSSMPTFDFTPSAPFCLREPSSMPSAHSIHGQDTNGTLADDNSSRSSTEVIDLDGLSSTGHSRNTYRREEQNIGYDEEEATLLRRAEAVMS